jgi:hypothetical protein
MARGGHDRPPLTRVNLSDLCAPMTLAATRGRRTSNWCAARICRSAVSTAAASYAGRMVRTLLAILLFLAASPLISSASDRPTRVILYTVTDPISGKLRPGYSVAKKAQGSCWSGSIGSSRPDAWRCMTGNIIIDPCFAPTMDTHIVYCPDSLAPKHLLALVLTKRLPLDHANQGSATASGRPTSLTLAGGATCSYVSGATGVVGGMRINYGCTDGRMLLGDVDRSAPRWRIYAMRRNSSSDVTLVDVESASF